MKSQFIQPYRRKTSNALNASVHCKQKRFQRLSETVPTNNLIPQAVWQGISDRQASHTESPSAIKAESVVRYDQELSGGRPEMLLWCDTSDWLPQFHEVRRHLTVQAVQHHARCGLGRFNFCYSLNNNEVILKQMQWLVLSTYIYIKFKARVLILTTTQTICPAVVQLMITCISYMLPLDV